MILCLAGTKGGAGRSTIATNFACIAAGIGLDVLLVDADDQETAADFTQSRKDDHPEAAKFTCTKLTGRAVRAEVLQLAPKYDHIIIDTGGRDTASQRAALSVSDIILVPFAPRQFDIWTAEKVAELVEEAQTANPKLRALAFLNRTDQQGHGNENQKAVAMLSEVEGIEFFDAPIRFRKAYAHSAEQGLAVTELTGQYRNPKAAEEIMKLFSSFFSKSL